MRIVVVGAGKVGRVLTEQLAAEKHDIVVIDQDSDLIESIVNIYDVRGVAGNGGCYDIQKDAFEDGADLLIAADCTAFAYGDFHRDFMRGRTCVIGCPKLDGVDYSEKLQAIIESNDIRSITVCRMEVPCCGGLEMAARNALARSGKDIPLSVTTFSVRGDIL